MFQSISAMMQMRNYDNKRTNKRCTAQMVTSLSKAFPPLAQFGQL